MFFDMTVRLDSIIVAATMLATGASVFQALRSDLKNMDSRLGAVENQLIGQTGLLVDIGKQEVRLADHERRLGKLEE